MKQCLWACCVLLYTVNALANPTSDAMLAGKVRDAKGAPLPGVVVQIPDLKIGTNTDTDGSFTLKGFPKGKYLVHLSLSTFASVTKSIYISDSTTVDFTLSETAIEVAEVIVTGQSKATEIRKSPAPLVAINSQYLKQNLSTNTIDAIAKVPGITAVSTGPNVSKPFIRGLGFNRVLTLYNGMRQEGQQWGDEHGVEVDDYNIDRVEVIKGPASLSYGSDALAGVVNLIPTQPAAEGKKVATLTTEYESNNHQLGGSLFASGNKKGLYWMGRLSHKQATNYTNSIDGRVYGTGYSQTTGAAGVGLNRSWGYAHLDASYFTDAQGVPDGSRDSASRRFTRQITEVDTVREIVSDDDLKSYAIPALHQLIQHYRVQSSNSFHVFGGRLGLGLGFQRNVRREYSHPEDVSVPGLFLQLNSYTYDAKYYLPEWKGLDVTIGVNGMYQVNDASEGTEFIIPSYRLFDAGPFVMIKKSLGSLDISGGARWDSRTYNNAALYSATDPATGLERAVSAGAPSATNVFKDYRKTFTGFSYSLGATYSLSKAVSVKANVARGFRSPNIAELSANGVHPGTNIYQLGNPDFKPEYSLQEDIGLDINTKHLSASISFFNNDISDYIYNRKVVGVNGQDSIIIPGNQTFRFSTSKARLQGFEASIDIHPHPLDWLHFENGISYVSGVNKGAVSDSERYLPFMPPLHGYSELRADFRTPRPHLKNLFAKVQVEFWAAQDKVYSAYGTETPTDGYTLLNAAIGTEITGRKGRTICTASLFANNLTDAVYQAHLSRLKYFEPYPNDPRGNTGIYSMGRNIGLRLEVPFSW